MVTRVIVAAGARAFPDRLRARHLLLARVRPDDPTPAWLPEAQRTILGDGRDCPLSDRLAANDDAYWIRAAGADRSAIGALTFQFDSDLLWTWLAIAPPWRHRGIAATAVARIERAAVDAGVTQARVLVPAGNGVGLFFWLRLGYRPLPRDSRLFREWRPPPWQGTWMARPLAESKAPLRGSQAKR